MKKKQKKVLKRIIVAAVLLVIIGIAGSVVSIPKWLEFLFYLVPYFVIGYDILRKAWKGICNRQMFDAFSQRLPLTWRRPPGKTLTVSMQWFWQP